MSVLIPVGSDEFLQECLESVYAQEVGPREVILFVDGRDHWDAAFEKVLWGDARCDMLIVPSERVGNPRARNDLAARARGEILASLDADDIWEPTYLKRQLESLSSHDGLAMSVAGVTHFLTPGALPGEVPPNLEKVLGIRKTVAVPSSIVMSKKTFEAVGLYDEQFPCSADVDWVLRANHAGVRRLDVHEPLVRKRVHRQSLSMTQPDLAEEIMRVIRKNRP